MKLTQKDNSYFINSKKEFVKNAIQNEFLEKAFEFAFAMAFGEGHHRNHRSGGQINRTEIEIFRNTFQGKLAEFVVYDFLLKNDITINNVDCFILGKGNWDDTDLVYKNINISVKSAAHFSNLFLLEAKDWDCQANYIPNLGAKNATKNYDYHILVRIQPNTNSLFANLNDKESLKNELQSAQWYFDIAGCCSHETVKYIIQHNCLLPQNAMLNGKIKMDASNYYIQAGNLKDITVLVEKLKTI